ncbi:probable ATP-dependent DNA helicase HFM1, partial [Nephila pilipes]
LSRETIGKNSKTSTQNYDGEIHNSRDIAVKNYSDGDSRSTVNLVPVSEIPFKYQSVFRSFPYFNVVQSKVFEDAFYTDKHLVVCAPTGSGKTVIFELSIVRLLMLISDLGQMSSRYKIVYSKYNFS